MPGAWPERSETEDEQRESETGQYEAMDKKQQKKVRVIGQPAARYNKAECLLGSGREVHVPLAENYCPCRIGVCVIFYFYPATCGPKGHGSGGGLFYLPLSLAPGPA